MTKTFFNEQTKKERKIKIIMQASKVDFLAVANAPGVLRLLMGVLGHSEQC